MFQQRLTRAEIQSVWREVESDFAAGLPVERDGLWHRVPADAETSALSHTPIIGCRTLDLLHVTAAKLIGVTEFCTFETRQAGLAGRIGLVVVLP